jgi:predicted DNA-binding transcriptional regulator YafY
MRNLLDFKNFNQLNESEIFEPGIMLFEDFNSVMTELQNAISNKFVCTIYYKGEMKGVVDDGYRYIEPYALGVNKHGNNVVRAWLIKGTSRRGRIDPSQVPGWRLFRVDRISIITPTLQKFTVPRKGYNADDQGMTEVTFSAQF